MEIKIGLSLTITHRPEHLRNHPPHPTHSLTTPITHNTPSPGQPPIRIIGLFLAAASCSGESCPPKARSLRFTAALIFDSNSLSEQPAVQSGQSKSLNSRAVAEQISPMDCQRPGCVGGVSPRIASRRLSCSSPNRQTFSFPSAVMRSRLQPPQK